MTANKLYNQYEYIYTQKKREKCKHNNRHTHTNMMTKYANLFAHQNYRKFVLVEKHKKQVKYAYLSE